jgi:hypothetical protein
MRSKWLEYRGKRILFQDFSGFDLQQADPLIEELAAVQAIVVQEPLASVLVLADFRETQLGRDLMSILTESSKVTQAYVKKTAVLGVRGVKRFLADTLIRMTGQPLSFFDDETEAKDWLIS